VPSHLHLFPRPQSLREHMIVPLEWWHLSWGSNLVRVTDLGVAT
jgi:hypothetical protein